MVGMTDGKQIERADPDTGERLVNFSPWKVEYHWRYEVRKHPTLENRFVVWDCRIDKPVVCLREVDNSMLESTAIGMAERLNKAYLELYPHKVKILVA
jgi:hypothetical protein